MNGKPVAMNQWDEGERGYGPIKRKFCGENRYIGVKNILEFYLTAGCELHIAPRNAIQTMVRMEWTVKEFFSNGGTTQFVDRVAGSLGIHASTIKIVSVYEGSIVLNYDITVASDSAAELESIQKTQTQQFATGKMDLGAPLLDVQSAATGDSSVKATATTSIISGGVVSAPGYKPIVITASAANAAGGAANTFVPDLPIFKVNATVVTNVNVTKTRHPIHDNLTILVGKNKTAVLIVAVALAFIVLLALVYCVRAIMFKANWERLEAAAVHAKQQEIAQACGRSQKEFRKVAPDGRTADAAEVVGTPQDGTTKGEYGTTDKLRSPWDDAPADGVQYEEQYDANADFRIFGVGDPTKGGVQSLQEKMNLADAVNKDESSDEDE